MTPRSSGRRSKKRTNAFSLTTHVVDVVYESTVIEATTKDSVCRTAVTVACLLAVTVEDTEVLCGLSQLTAAGAECSGTSECSPAGTCRQSFVALAAVFRALTTEEATQFV